MKTPPTFVAVIAFASWSIAACSSAVEPPPHSDGYVAGGTQTGSSQGAGSSSSAPTGSSGGGSSSGSSGGTGPTGSSSGGGSSPAPDAGSSAPVKAEAGAADSGYFIDSGSPVTNPTPSGPPGSCTNPMCGTDGNECGCTATDSNGNTIQLGCQAGGQCGCFENQQLVDQPFDENGTCNAATLAAQQFLQNCTCN